jgi:hypothetical protein
MSNLVLSVEILGEFKKLTQATTGATKQLNGISKTTKKISNTMRNALGAIGVGFSLNAVVNGVKDVVNAASDLGEATNAINVAFGDSSKEIIKFGKNAAQAIGLSKTELYGIATQFSSFAKQVGGEGGATQVIEDLATRGADFASVFNLDVADALGKFQSGLAGQSEPLRQFGIDLSAAAVEAYAVENGIIKQGEAMTESQKVLARYGLLMQETAMTQGDFANTSDGLANTQRILKAEFENLKAEVGEALLPVMIELFTEIRDNLPAIKQFIQTFVDTVKWVIESRAVIIPLTIAVGALTTGFKAYAAIMTVVAARNAAVTASNVALATSNASVAATATAARAAMIALAGVAAVGAVLAIPGSAALPGTVPSTMPKPAPIAPMPVFPGNAPQTGLPGANTNTTKPTVNQNIVINTPSTNPTAIVSSLQGYQNQTGANIRNLLR